jgi:putative flavoprotein involved in K+ transport
MENGRYVLQSDSEYFEADNVVIAMANYQQPKVPFFVNKLDPAIVQFHSSVYRNPDQLQKGDVLLVGAGNSASELAMELSRTHRVYMSGRDTGVVPFRIGTKLAKFLFLPLVLKVIFHRILTINTAIGRKVRSKILTIGGPLIRVKPKDLEVAGVIRVPKTIGIQNGLPLLENEKVMDVKNVIWCTGFHPGFSWIKLPVLGEHEPKHRAGIVPTQPGLYFTGLHFLYSFSSTMIQGVDRDAKRIVNHMVMRMKTVA